jgi:PAS domain S-box-containing protein
MQKNVVNLTREDLIPSPALVWQVLVWTLVLVGLYVASLYNYNLFHSLAEFFSIIIAVTLFLVAWNSRQIIDNNYLLFLGIGYLFVGCLDLLHALAYKGMGVFNGYGPNLPTQLWIGARYLEAVTLLLSPFFFKRRLNPYLALGSFALAAALFLLAIFGVIFPDCFIEGVGLTPFKIVSEYVICVILVGALVLLFKNRSEFHPKVFTLLVWSIILTVAQEVFFTLYSDVFGLRNLFGHYLKILSFYLIYKAVIQTGLMRPYDFLFRNLKLREEAIQGLNEELQIRIQEAKEHAVELAKANRSLHESEERLRMFIEHAPSSLAMFDKEMRYLSASRCWLRDYNMKESDLLGLSYYEAFQEIPESWKQIHRRGLEGEVVLAEADRFERADGSLQWLRWEVRPWYDSSGKVAGVVIFTEDITERKLAEEALQKAHNELEKRVIERTADLRHSVAQLEWEITERQRVEEALRHSEERLRLFTAKLMAAQETERGRLSRELHDDLGQALLVLRMQLNSVLRRCSLEAEPQKGLEEAATYLLGIIDKVRRISHDLCPSILERLGLSEALLDLFEEFQKYCGQEMTIKADLDDVKNILPEEANIVIYRITQEFLANVHKHSEATQVRVAIKAMPEKVTINLEDNGKGFVVDEIKDRTGERRGLGLASMEERLRMLGSRYSLTSQPGVGTRLYFEILRTAEQKFPGALGMEYAQC